MRHSGPRADCGSDCTDAQAGESASPVRAGSDKCLVAKTIAPQRRATRSKAVVRLPRHVTAGMPIGLRRHLSGRDAFATQSPS